MPINNNSARASAPASFIELQENSPTNKYLGGMVGLLVGDAAGVPYEFQSPHQLPAREYIEMSPPANFRRSHGGVPIGTWSDDGAQALCLFSSMAKYSKVEIHDFSQRLCDWYKVGYFAVDGKVFDVGIQTSDAIALLMKGTNPYQSGGATESNNGNGSLMRVLPLALLHKGDNASMVKESHLQSIPTHAHARSLVACGFYCLVARAYLNAEENPWGLAAAQLQTIYQDWDVQEEGISFLNELDTILTSPLRDHPTGSGYVVDTLWSAKKALEESSFEDVIKTAIGFGNDTDTSACVAGGLAGIRFGLGGIPKRWLAQLRGWELYSPYIPAPCC